MLLDETPAVLSLGEALRRSWVYQPLDQWFKTTSHQKWQKNQVQKSEIRSIRCPWSVDEFFKLIFTYVSNIFIEGYCDQHGKILQQKEVKFSVRSHGDTRRVDQQKPKTQIKMKTTKIYEVSYCKMCRNGYRISRRIWWIRMLNDINTLPALLMNCQWGREQKWHRNTGNCDICVRTKITGASCRRRTGTAVPRAAKFGDLITADHKVLSENCESRNNHRYSFVVQDLATQWIQSYPCETKTSQDTQRSLQKFLEPNRKPKVKNTDNSLEFRKCCEDLSWNHRTSTPHRSETNGIAERAVRRVKEGTSAVFLQSGLDEKWWVDSMECYCYLRNIQDLLSDGKTPYEKRFGIPFNGPVIPFGAMVEFHPICAKDLSRLHQFGRKVSPGIFFGHVLYAGKGDIKVADIEELEASELHARRLDAKEMLTPMKSEHFSQSQMDQSKLEKIRI